MKSAKEFCVFMLMYRFSKYNLQLVNICYYLSRHSVKQLLVSLLVVMDLPTVVSCSWPFRVVLMLVLRALALSIASGLAAPTHTAMMTWRPGQRFALAPAPTPAR